MTSPRSSDTRSTRSHCATPGCEQSPLVSASVCRTHLVDILRAEGEVIPGEEGDFAGVMAAAIHILRLAFEGVPQEEFDREPRTEMDMYALLPMDAEWAMAQMSLDFLGTHIADTFGAMQLSPPTEFMSKVLLRLRVVGPGSADELRPRLRFAMESMIREFAGPDVEMTVAVEPPDEEA
jgi:hypothetical protein